ncbi:MAG: hypothetical protein AAGF35_01650 [Pseudomonadota bacterium]
MLLVLSVFYLDQSLPSELTAWSRILGILWCVIVALALSHIVHEWFHFLGALVGRASVTIKQRVHPLFFDFDFPSNNHSQFLWLSFGGLLGNILLIAYFALTHFQSEIVANSLLAAALGQFVFVLILELPVSLRVIAGQGPLTALTEHFSQGAPLFLRALLFGVMTASIAAATLFLMS